MTAIMGENALSQQAPMIPSILKLAKKRGMFLSKLARKKLQAHIELRQKAARLKKLKDWKTDDKVLRRAFPHQRADLLFMKKMGLPAYLNASKTGVGKTLVALLWAHSILGAKRVLIITRNNTKDQWKDAICFWIGCTTQSVQIVGGTVEEQIEQANTNAKWTIGHWESLVHAGEGYTARAWDVIILDEAQYMYNRKTYRAELALQLKAPYRMIATAHPFDKHPGQIFSLLQFLYPSLYKSYWRFFNMHVKAYPKPFGGFEIEGARRPKMLAWEIAPFRIMRTKKEVFKDLPPVAHVRRTVTLSPRGQKEYDRLKKAVFAELDAVKGGTKFIPIINDLVRVTRTRQYLIDPGLIGARERPLKYDAVLEILDEINAPTVIFTSFQKAGRRLGAFLQQHKMRVGYIDGKVKKRNRLLSKKKFLQGKLDALIVVRSSGDTGLNLGKYGYLISLDLPWTFKGVEQAEGRVDRPEEKTGKLVPTTAYTIIVKGSYEERLERRLSRQHTTFNDVFTVENLRELFA